MMLQAKDMQGSLQISPFCLVQQILGSAPRKRQDRERWILVWIGDEAGPVRNEHVLGFMSLAESVQHGSFRTVSHAGRAEFVNDFATEHDAIGILAARLGACEIRATGSLNNCLHGLLHIFSHLDFVVTPFEVESEHRNAPLIHHFRINLTIGLLVWNHLAAPGRAFSASAIPRQGGDD